MHDVPTKAAPRVGFDNRIPKSGPEIFILRLKANSNHTMTVLGDEIVGIWVHWTGKKSEPHYEPSEECRACLQKRPKRWKGFLHCFDHVLGQEVFLELTPASASNLAKQLPKTGALRANRFSIRRGAGDSARMQIQLLTVAQQPEALPPQRDPRPSILKLWGIDDTEKEGWLPGEGEIASDFAGV